MSRRCIARIAIQGCSAEQARAIEKALRPEIRISSTRRDRVRLFVREAILDFHFEAESIPALRALINTYLRWVITISNVLRTVEHVQLQT